MLNGFCDELVKISQAGEGRPAELPAKARALNIAKQIAIPAAGAGVGLGAGTLARHLAQKHYGAQLTPMARRAFGVVPAALMLGGGIAAKGLAKARSDYVRELEEKALQEQAQK